MENTLENKAKFFAQYWGQKVFMLNGGNTEIGKWSMQFDVSAFGKIKLTPLSKITDEDMDAIATIINPKRINRHNLKVLRNEKCALLNFQAYEVVTVFFNGTIMYKDLNGVDTYTLNALTAYQYLQSKGYALPFHDLSVDDLVGYGWLVLS